MKCPLLILLSVLLTFATTVSGRWPMQDTLADYYCNRNHGTNPDVLFCIGFDRFGNPSSYQTLGQEGCLTFKFKDEAHRNRLVQKVVPPVIQRPDNKNSPSVDPDYVERSQLCDVVLVFNQRGFFVLLNTRMHHGGFPLNPIKRSLKFALKSFQPFDITEEITSQYHAHLIFDVAQLDNGWTPRLMYGDTEMESGLVVKEAVTLPSSPDITWHKPPGSKSEYQCQELDQGCFARFAVKFQRMKIERPKKFQGWFDYPVIDVNLDESIRQFLRVESRAEYTGTGGSNDTITAVDCFSFRSINFRYVGGVKVTGKNSDCISLPGSPDGSQAAAGSEGDSKGGSAWWIWVIVVVITLLILLLVGFCIMRRRRRGRVSSSLPSQTPATPTRSVLSSVTVSTPTSKAASGARKSSASKKTGKKSKK